MKEKALSCAGLRDLRLTFSPAWLRNFVAACGLARSTAAYDGDFGVYVTISPKTSHTLGGRGRDRPMLFINIGLHETTELIISRSNSWFNRTVHCNS